jgi:hypothetical protein
MPQLTLATSGIQLEYEHRQTCRDASAPALESITGRERQDKREVQRLVVDVQPTDATMTKRWRATRNRR